MNKLKSNLGNSIRREELDGKSYLVANVVLIVEGVLNGLYYPAEEMADKAQAWNGSPLTLNHPSVNGVDVSANSPEVLSDFAIGKVFGTRFQPKNNASEARLVGEAWIEEDRLNQKVAEGNEDAIALNDKLQRGQVIEVSTGLWTNDEDTAGQFNGKEYKAIARTYRPDHLAILPRKVGACSIADGCGLMRNKQILDAFGIPNQPNNAPSDDAKGKTKTKDPNPMDELVDKVIANEANGFTAEDKASLLKMNEEVLSTFLPQEEEPEGDPKANAEEDLKGNCGCQGEEAKATPAPKEETEEQEAPALNEEKIAEIVANTIKELVPGMIAASAKQDEKAKLVAALTANEACDIDAAALGAMDVATLGKLTKTYTEKESFSYAGKGSVRVNRTEGDDTPTMPKIDWSKKR